jgi:hypothetical protein
MKMPHTEKPKYQRREPIDTKKARQLYDKLGTWRRVAGFLRRKDGSAFQPNSIRNAVNRDESHSDPIDFTGSPVLLCRKPTGAGS